jgi:hypothetical protein
MKPVSDRPSSVTTFVSRGVDPRGLTLKPRDAYVPDLHIKHHQGKDARHPLTGNAIIRHP